VPDKYAVSNEIEQLDPTADCQRIIYLLGAYEHPWLMRKALEFALFRTYAVPSISRLLRATQQFQQHGQKRYDDTSLLISTITEEGYDSEFGRRAIARMKHWHGKYRIRNEDFLYVLSVFIYEPVRWIDRYGWRPTTAVERKATYHFWAEVGRRMKIADIPPDYAAFERFNVAYEREHFVYADSNHAIGEATVQIFLHWYPAWIRPGVRRAIYAMMDDPLLAAFGFPQAGATWRWLVPRLLTLRKHVKRVLPPRRTPYRFTQAPNRTYPHGYRVDELGPQQPVKVTGSRYESSD